MLPEQNLAMFPLGNTVLPGDLLQLNVFEHRYLELVAQVLKLSDPVFGTVLIERGSEVGGSDSRFVVGTLMRVVRADFAAPGLMNILVEGIARIRIHEWLDEQPFPRARISLWSDLDKKNENGENIYLVDRVSDIFLSTEATVRLNCKIASELQGLVHPLQADINPDLTAGSFQLASMAPIGALDRYKLLCCDGPIQRLIALSEMMSDFSSLLAMQINQHMESDNPEDRENPDQSRGDGNQE